MLGWRPRDLYDATPFEFWHAWDGFAQFHQGQPEADPLTRRELDDLLRQYGQ